MATLNNLTVSGVIFDMDGVIIDSMPTWDMLPDLYIESLGIESPGNLGQVVFAMTLKGVREYLIERFHLDKTEQQVKEEIDRLILQKYHYEIPEKKGVIELIKAMHEEGIPIVMATTCEKRMVEPALKRYGIRDCFIKICTSEEYHCSKDVPDMFYAALDIMGTKAEETFLFEDALHSIETAHKIGMKTVGVFDAASMSKQEKIKETADIYIRSYDDLHFQK